VKIAIHKSIQHDFDSVFVWREWWDEEPSYPEHVRISEWIDVDFPPLSDDTLLQNQVTAIDQQIKAVTDKWKREVDDLKSTKASLLALTHKESA